MCERPKEKRERSFWPVPKRSFWKRAMQRHPCGVSVSRRRSPQALSISSSRIRADLFKSLVEEPLQKVYAAMMAHYREEAETAPQTLPEHLSDSRDFQTALEIIHYMYQYYDECLLVLTKAQGSGFENFVDRLVDITKQHYRELADRYCRMFQQPLLDDYTVRWMAHMHVDMFVHLIIHERSEAAACRHMEQMIYYLSCGFFAMIQNPPRNPDVELPEHSNTGNKT